MTAKPYLFDVQKLAACYSPFSDEPPWRANTHERLVMEEVMKALKENRLEAECWSQPQTPFYLPEWPIERHAARIAYLAAHGWDEPIELDFWDRGFGPHPFISDGNHRFAAAIFMQLPSIEAYYAGHPDHAKKFMWVSEPDGVVV